MINILFHIILIERIKINKESIDKIIELGEYNIKKTLWIMQMYMYKIDNYELSWKQSLNKLIDYMVEFKKNKITILNERLIINTRTILYNIFTTNIPGIDILYEIINKIIISEQFESDLLYIIMQISSSTETRLIKGKRSIIHLDTFMCKLYKEIYNYYHKIK
jgi:hypothetical protein